MTRRPPTDLAAAIAGLLAGAAFVAVLEGDLRLTRRNVDDLLILGRPFTQDPNRARRVGLAVHALISIALAALYARVERRLPGPPLGSGPSLRESGEPPPLPDNDLRGASSSRQGGKRRSLSHLAGALAVGAAPHRLRHRSWRRLRSAQEGQRARRKSASLQGYVARIRYPCDLDRLCRHLAPESLRCGFGCRDARQPRAMTGREELGRGRLTREKEPTPDRPAQVGAPAASRSAEIEPPR